tara:strand:+ start:1672 stop:2355 length:684 start_codon:yes stop_codon:yes gene_type:complete
MLIGRYKIDININNFIFEIDIRESIERKTYFLKNYEQHRMKYLIKNSLKIKSNILIDVGANIGFYSILLSKNFDYIYSYEPNNRNFNILTKNILKNNLQDKINTFNYGLGERKETLKGSSRNKGELIQTSGFAISENNKDGEDVLIHKGDEVLSFRNKVITVKIDVEGFEFFVLKGLIELLKNNHCYLQVEIWDKNKDIVYQLLDKLNYKKIGFIDGDTYFSNIKIN